MCVMMFNTQSHEVTSLIVLCFKFNKNSVTRTQKDMQLSAIQCVTEPVCSNPLVAGVILSCCSR